MNLNTLQDFRHGMYHCFGNAKDALFNLVDALASEAGARSFPELSFSPFFERSWASLYEALEDGQIDAERLRQLFVDFAPLPAAGESVFLGIDTSNLYRPEAETAEDRTLVPIANLPKNTHAASPGWVMSHVVLLPTQAGQGTFVLDTARVASTELATEVAARQLRAVVALLRGAWVASHHCRRPLVRLRAVPGSPGRRRGGEPVARQTAIASSTGQPRHVFPASWEPVARMGSAFNARTRAVMANRMRPGKGWTPKGRASRCAVGPTCTCAGARGRGVADPDHPSWSQWQGS